MTAEVASRTTEVARIQTTRLLLPDTLPTKPLQEEELMSLRTVDQLLPHVQAQARQRFPFHVKQLMGAVDIAVTQFDGHKPRRDGTDAAIHPVRTLYRALVDDPDLTPVQGAMFVLHDTIEDCNLNQQDLEDLLRIREEEERFPYEDIRRIAFGSFVFSRIKHGRKLPQLQYMKDLEDLHWADFDIGIIKGKSWDTIDNGKNDSWVLIDDPDSIDPDRVLAFAGGKGEDVSNLAKKYLPSAPSTKILQNTMDETKQLALKERDVRRLGIRENERQETEMRRERKALLRRAIARVPT